MNKDLVYFIRIAADSSPLMVVEENARIDITDKFLVVNSKGKLLHPKLGYRLHPEDMLCNPEENGAFQAICKEYALVNIIEPGDVVRKQMELQKDGTKKEVTYSDPAVKIYHAVRIPDGTIEECDHFKPEDLLGSNVYITVASRDGSAGCSLDKDASFSIDNLARIDLVNTCRYSEFEPVYAKLHAKMQRGIGDARSGYLVRIEDSIKLITEETKKQIVSMAQPDKTSEVLKGFINSKNQF